MAPFLGAVELQRDEREPMNIRYTRHQVPSTPAVLQQYGNLWQRDENHQHNATATSAEFQHAQANNQYSSPSRNPNMGAEEVYRRMNDPPTSRRQFAARSGQTFRTNTALNVNTVAPNRESDSVYSLSECGEPSAVSMYAVNLAPVRFLRNAPASHVEAEGQFTTEEPHQGVADRNASREEDYSPIGRWKSEAFRDSPWHGVDYADRRSRRPSLRTEEYRNIPES